MRKVVLISVMLSIITAASASTFQGDVQRTGNFSSDGQILPVLAWKQEITGLVGSSPVYSNGHVYVTNWYGWGTWSPGLYSLNATTGELEWRNDKITGASSVAVYGDTVIVGNLSGHIYYVNATTGEIENSILLESSPSWWGIASSPLIYNGIVYVTTFSNGTLWSLDNGNVRWKFTTGGEISHYTSPAAYNGIIFFAGNESGSNALFAVNESGNLVWKFPVEGKITNTPTVGYGKVFVATDKKFYAINLNGSKAWSVNFSGTMSSAAVAYDKVYVGSSDGKLYCFDADNGSIIWEFTANGKIDSSPAVAGKAVYFATNTPQGTIYAVNADTGSLFWYYRLTPPSGSYYNIMSSPFIANNRLYIGADSGFVYCFNISGSLEYNVSIIPGKFDVAVNGKTYSISRATALGALFAAREHSETFFEITLDDSWYEQTKTLFISSIMGLGTKQVNGKWIYWSIWNESKAMIPVGADAYQISGNETIYYCYGEGDLETCSVLLVIRSDVKPAGVLSLEVSDGRRGGNVTAWVNVTSAENDWYVLVVSGVNGDGEAIAGISTFRLNAGEELRVPVLVHIPQLADKGKYNLYAGVYRLSDYPGNPIHVYGKASCEVS
uniref:Pyrrolo-quinoline quinone n=1 Tax=Archaeoglobus fulgidus TaxID=2234 RepID=A0A7C2SK25_ARCFL